MSSRQHARRTGATRPDEGSVLVLVLVLVVIGALIVVPTLNYAVTTMRANTVVVSKTKRQEAVKAGLRVALADPLRLYEHCGTVTGGAIGAPVHEDGSPINDIAISTNCDLLAQASAQESEDLHLGVVVTKAGAKIPAGMTAVPRLHEDGSPVTDGDGNPTYYVYETGAEAIDRWWDPAVAEPDAEYVATKLVQPRHIWAPNLPSHGTELRTGSYKMPDGYSWREGRECRVFFPGIYKEPVWLDQDVDYFFTSGIYYFEDTVTVTGNADVVVGMGSAQGCVTDQEAAFYAISGPSSHEVSGLGATFVFGSKPATQTTPGTNGRLVVHQAGNVTPTIRFNQRYVHPLDVAGYGSYGVSIASVNGRIDPTDSSFQNLDLPGLNSVPLSQVGGVELPYELDPVQYPDQVIPQASNVGVNTDDYTGAAYRPSALTYEPSAPYLDDDFVNNVQFAAVYRTADTDNSGAVVIRWQHPEVEDMNGAAIQSYTVTANGPASPAACTWTAPAPGDPVPPLECVFTGLASPHNNAGTETTFSIVADNGKPSESVTKSVTITRKSGQTNTRPLAGTPARPAITNVTAHETGVVVSFDPLPLDQSGNAPVQEYTVHYRDLADPDPLAPTTGSVGCTVTAPDYFDPDAYTPPVAPLSCVIPLPVPLVDPVQPYSFQVTATNYNGDASTVDPTDSSWATGTLTWAPNPADPLPTGPAPTAWVPFVVPEKVPDPIVHIDLSQDDDDALCVDTPSGSSPQDLADAMAAVPELDDVVVQIPGYIATPQGLVQVDNPCARTRLIATGGLLAADIALNGAGAGGNELTVAIGIENPLVQRTVRITTLTTKGLPAVRSTAVVQINETGEYRINSWEVQ